MKFLFILGIVLLMFGVILIFDARPITKNMFGFGDQNEGAMGLKIVGFVVNVIGLILIYCNI